MKCNKEVISLQNRWKAIVDFEPTNNSKYVFIFMRGSDRKKFKDRVVLKLSEEQIGQLYDSIHPQTGIGVIKSIDKNIIDADVFISQLRTIVQPDARYRLEETRSVSEKKSLVGFNGGRESIIMVSTDTANMAITLDMFKPGSMRLISIMEQILDIHPELRTAR